jgi:hypothetical protein
VYTAAAALLVQESGGEASQAEEGVDLVAEMDRLREQSPAGKPKPRWHETLESRP